MIEKLSGLMRPRGLITQLLVWVIVPLLIILAVITYGDVTLHEHAMRDLVGERDAGATRAAAQALTDRFVQRQLTLGVLANRLADGVSLAHILATETELKLVFDGGLIAVDPQGHVIDTWQQGSDWTAYLHSASAPWVLDHDTAKPLVIANASSADGRILLFGGISLDSMNISQAIGLWQQTPQDRFFIVADDLHIIQDSAGIDTGKSAKTLPGLAELFKSGSQQYVFHADAQDLITVSSPVDKLNWTLVVQEAWQDVASKTLRLSAAVPLALIPALLFVVSVLVFGITGILLPLRRLGQYSARLAWGDYNTAKVAIGGSVREIHDLQVMLTNLAQRLQQAQSGMHSYIGAMLQGQEDERKRLSRELHDDTLQALIALDQQRQMAQRALANDPAKAAKHLDRLKTTLEQTIADLRRVIRDMRPSYLEDLGLVPTLEALTVQTKEITGIAVDFLLQGTPQRLPVNYELSLYRIAQEAVVNASRYAHPSRISLTLSFDQPITLRVHDNGKGFIVPARPDSFAQTGHYGLMGMVERAEQIGAEFKLDSAPDKGTTISVHLDLAHPKRVVN